MGDPQRKCSNCGALPPRASARFCEYCGAELPRLEPAPAPPSPFGDLRRRFADLQAHPDVPELMAYSPPTGVFGIQTAMSVALLVLFGVVGLVVSIAFLGACPPLGFLPLAVVAIGGFALLKQLTRTEGARNAPLERRPAIVVDERTNVSGGGESRSLRTLYYATLEFPDGTRREYDVFANVAGKITRGDMGIAYVKGDYLVQFARVAV